MSGSEHKVPVEEKNANKKEKLIRRPRLKLKKYVTEAFKEVKLHEKITFEVTNARGEREEETGISNFQKGIFMLCSGKKSEMFYLLFALKEYRL